MAVISVRGSRDVSTGIVTQLGLENSCCDKFQRSEKAREKKEISVPVQLTLFPFALVLIQLLHEACIRKLIPKPDVIGLGLQTRARDTGSLRSSWEFGSLDPWVRTVSTELADLVVDVLIVDADEERIVIIKTDHGE